MSAKVDLSVYGILDPERSKSRDLADLAVDAVRGGATFLQLRDKHGTTRRMVAAARAILAGIEGSGVPLVINDRGRCGAGVQRTWRACRRGRHGA